jgi:hypothetical protein
VVPAFVLLISRESAGVVKFGMAARWLHPVWKQWQAILRRIKLWHRMKQRGHQSDNSCSLGPPLSNVHSNIVQGINYQARFLKDRTWIKCISSEWIRELPQILR